ncbi:hypothetical protein BFO_3161 [Tannerella forsythia 92A2]|uniref:Uncharacterized protein n=1 Tax=Tannerella forsythia (strain ATCC 43037 / JCM 10827 / CCUG 21028 A / KCTC 5666 / FDC 338) TaxID=203275 RepID=G8UR32_TANFA|nr:hypothetical protein BFO_3161 [Tannerella forsythia 92A2]
MLYDFAVLETENLIKIDAMRYTRKLQFLVRYLGEVFEFELKKGGAENVPLHCKMSYPFFKDKGKGSDYLLEVPTRIAELLEWLHTCYHTKNPFATLRLKRE